MAARTFIYLYLNESEIEYQIITILVNPVNKQAKQLFINLYQSL